MLSDLLKSLLSSWLDRSRVEHGVGIGNLLKENAMSGLGLALIFLEWEHAKDSDQVFLFEIVSINVAIAKLQNGSSFEHRDAEKRGIINKASKNAGDQNREMRF